jgi:hypothetical protein
LYVYEYEFKKSHRAILEKNNKMPGDLNANSFNTQFNYFNYTNKKKLSNYSYRLLLKRVYYKNNIDVPTLNVFN